MSEHVAVTDEVMTKFHDQGDGFVINRLQDVEPHLDRCKRLSVETTGKSPSGDLYHVGDFPMVFVEAYMNLNKITFNEFIANKEHVKKLSEDPALAHYRVWKGKL